MAPKNGYKILVTGGAGYIGSILVPQLLARGHQVTVLDNFMYRQNSLAQVCADPNFQVVRGDVRLKETLAPLLAEAEVLIPLAALVGAPLCDRDPVAAQSTNHEAMLQLFEMAAEDQWILMPTTNSAYGTGDENNFCTEESELRPISRYARDKVAVEKALMSRKNAVSFRLATVFGLSPRMRFDLLVNDFVQRACTDKFIVLFEAHFKRNYLHIRDVASVFLHALTNFPAMRGQIYNVGLSSANLSKKELCERIQRQIPDFVFLEAPLGQDPDQRNYIVSNAKIEAAGWRPGFDLDRGIAELIKGCQMLNNKVYGNV